MTITTHRLLRRGWIVLLAIILLVPVVSWVAHASFADAVIDGEVSPFFFFQLLGQVTGIIGAQLFAFVLILSARLAFIEKLFGGLDKLYVIHHRVGVIAFSLLAVHPILLAFRFVGTSYEEVAHFLNPIGNTLPIILGMCAIIGMLSLLLLTFYGSIFMYPTLKLAHRFLGAAFFLGFLHILLIPGSLSSDVVLKVSLVTTSGIGILAYTYRTLLGRWLVPRFKYQVSSVKDLGGQMTEIVLDGAIKKMYHMPGQFGMLAFKGASGIPDEEHPFTLSSSGTDGTLRFSIKGLGDYTKTLGTLTVGTEARVEGPFGEFSYLYGKEKQVWIAGGVGVTPFVSMAEHMLQSESLPYVVDFYYSARSEADGVYRELFQKLSEKHPSFVFHFMPSDTKGYISGELLLKEITDLTSRDIFICGPPGLMAALTDQLEALKIKSNTIHSERFVLLK